MALRTKRSWSGFVSLAWALISASLAAADDRVASVLDSIAPPSDWLNAQERAIQYPQPIVPVSARQPGPAAPAAAAVGGLWANWSQPALETGFANGLSIDTADEGGAGISAWVDWIFLTRERAGDELLLIGPGGEPLNGDVFAFDFRPGIETGVELSLGNSIALEFRYFWVDDWSRSATTAALPGSSLATVPPTGPLGPPYDVTYMSGLQSFEFNVRAGAGDIQWLAGFRSVDLDEQFLVGALPLAPLPSGFANFAADNNLSGFQIGADALLWDDGNWFTLSGVAKTGIYYVDARGTVTGAIGPTFAPLAGRAGTQEVALLGEFGLDATWLLTGNWRLRSGYRVIYVDGIASASSLVPNSSQLAAATPLRVQADSSIFYHGLNLGLELSW